MRIPKIARIYTARDRRTLGILLFIIFLQITFYFISPFFWEEENIDYIEFAEKIEEYNRNLQTPDYPGVAVDVPSFDINQVSSEELVRYGLPLFVAKRWEKFREASGGFNSVTDVERIYGIDPEWLIKNADKMTVSRKKKRSIPQNRNEVEYKPPPVNEHRSPEKEGSVSDSAEIKHDTSSSPKKKWTKKDFSTIVDINQSDEYQWQMLKGIGPYYAKRIVKFRKALGGFSSIGQVSETYQLPDSVFQSIRPFLKLSQVIKKN